MTCEQCELQKEMGAKRPTCEECGKIILTDESIFISNLINTYFHSIVQVNGMGGWNISVEGLKEILKEHPVDSIPTVLKRLGLALSIVLRSDKKEDEDDAR